MLSELLRLGFRLANRRLSLIFFDLLWKLIWLVMTLSGLLLIVVWFGSQFRSIQWIDTGNRALNTAIAIRILREFWLENSSPIVVAAITLLFLSMVVWFVLEAGFRSRLFSSVRQRFSTFLLSNLLRLVLIASAAMALGTISFGRFFATPIDEWPQLWPDARGAAFISLVTVAALAFLLTIVDTLVRGDAIELLGTDLFRVTGLLSILIWFEAMIVSACTISLSAGFLNTASLRSALGMLAATIIVVGLLNVLHSYLLLVRYSAVYIMRQNVIEI